MTFMYKSSISLLLFLKFAHSQNVPEVNTTQGLVSGLPGENGDYWMYLGIPYGAVDPDNPFGPSSPAPQFEGIFNATDDSARCPQGEASDTLDCLHLNVFVPFRNESDELLPVLVFIHGGAFLFGAFGRESHGGRFLVRHDVIFVSLNYRLGVYGYMCTDNARVPGNQASKDQLLALRWVNSNIASFGGDPNKVTLSGNSAGGMSIDLIISSDEGPRLFQQAILQSGVSFLPSYPPTVRDSPLRLAQHFDYLASVDPLHILIASQQQGLMFRPCIERKFEGIETFMTENWVSKRNVRVSGMNIMVGFNENEALGLLLQPNSNLINVVEQGLSSTFSTEHEDFSGREEVTHFFFGDETLDDTQFKAAIDLLSDNSFVHHSLRSVERYLDSDVEKVYMYLFSYDGDRNIVKNGINTTLAGAVHADELGYLFDVANYPEPNADDQLTIDRLTLMWTNFVKYGNPTPQQTAMVPVTWEAITPGSPYHYIHIDSELQVGTRLYNERMAFWDLFLELNGHLQRFLIDNAE